MYFKCHLAGKILVNTDPIRFGTTHSRDTLEGRSSWTCMSWRITEALESVVFHDSPPVKITGPKRRDSTCSVYSSPGILPMALGDWSFYHATSSWVAPRGVGCHEEGVVVCIWHPYHMIPRLYEQILWKVIFGTEWSKPWFVLPFFEVEAPIAGTKVLWPTRTLPSSRLQFAKDGVAKQKFDCFPVHHGLCIHM